ncbi:nucleoporin NUP42 [Antennarius striatus]|uniref:nucleoporin NUP42 n=1 Tax=Antennarius striatus TaxID=241820 RepID=UPI0035B047A3
MTVCSFFLEGRCRYGDKCWNEHPRGGNRGGGGYNNYNRGYNDNSYSRSSTQQQSRGGGGGFGNRVWVNPSQQKGGYIQPSSFSSRGSDDWSRGGAGGNDWGRGGDDGGGGRSDNRKASEFSFSSQNRFSALGTPSSFERGGRGGGQQVSTGDDDDDRKLDIIQMDMDTWESSGQWGFSCYSNGKTCLSGFSDVSPEELRQEYYTARASGDLQGYINGTNQLLQQWRNRVQELKIMNPNTRTALLKELNNQASPSGFQSPTEAGFGSTPSTFGSKGFGAPAPVQASSFRFAASDGGFGSTAAPTQPASGFGSSSGVPTALSSSSFSFSAPTSSTPAVTSGFGSASGSSFSSTANAGGGFGVNFGAPVPAVTGSSSVFGQTNVGFGTAASAVGAKSTGGASASLFSPEDKLTPEELNQFKAKRFTLGQIPLRPPPANMLML